MTLCWMCVIGIPGDVVEMSHWLLASTRQGYQGHPKMSRKTIPTTRNEETQCQHGPAAFDLPSLMLEAVAHILTLKKIFEIKM